MIYLDYQATTPCDQRVLDKMLPYFCEIYGNPHSSTHVMGEEAADAVEKARAQVADIISAENPKDIIFTSGATEANNLAIQGIAHFYKERGNRIITSVIEHPCVLETCKALAREGFDVVFVPVLSNGIIDLDSFKKAITSETILASIMTVNNEIGTCQPIDEIGKLCHERGIIFHTDAAQAIGKIPVNVKNIDLMSISGHKIYGPKGIGALYINGKERLRVSPLFHGGRQERGMRSGTLPTPLCVGIGAACEIAAKEMREEYTRLVAFKSYFLRQIFDNLPKVYLNGDRDKSIPGCINLSFDGVEGEGIMLGMRDICVSSGSACSSQTLEPSYVLKSLSIREDLAHSSIRIGFGRFTTQEEIEYTASKIIETVRKLRKMSPIWND
ncbi:MAG: IscS subfamily cysteine desulfurase [Alphaproteobacteria bacterium]|nr:IscS subfamily cysteine desulfurase [Alphaproteobacteria bacterium]